MYEQRRSVSQRLLWFPPISSQPISLSTWCRKPLPDVNKLNGIREPLCCAKPVTSSVCSPHERIVGLRHSNSENWNSTQNSVYGNVRPLFIDANLPSLNDSATISETSSDSGIGSSGLASPQIGPKRCSSYTLKNSYCLTAPYQSFPRACIPNYLYTWLLPSSDVLANLASIDHRCFISTDQVLGLLFSKPISQNDYVCRVPVYLDRGMARVRVRLVGQVCFSDHELDTIIAAHNVLAELLTNIADLSHVGLLHADRRLRRVMDNKSEGPSLVVRNSFAELEFNPTSSSVLGLVVVMNKNGKLDMDAATALVQWSKNREQWDFRNDSVPPTQLPSLPVVGVLSAYPLRLSQLPPSQWAGLMVRPCHLPDNDPAMFAVSGASPTTGLHPVKPEMAEKLALVLNPPKSATHGDDINENGAESSSPMLIAPVLSYMDYFVIRYPPIHDLLDTLDPSLPLAFCSRLTRHQNAAQVTAGMRKDKRLNAGEKSVLYLPDTCFVHPLSAWLWFLLSILPVVLYQISRSTSALELFNLLHRELSATPVVRVLQSEPDPTVLVPDRLNAPRCMLSELYQCTSIDLDVHSRTPSDILLQDQLASSDVFSDVCPHPNKLLEATTLLAARDAVNLERLELLGDSLLRLIGTLTVYTSSPTRADEGSLSAKRSFLVSNSNLCNIAVRLGWQKYCTAQMFSPPEHFVFPCYAVSKATANADGDSRLVVKLTDKSLADMIEALIGCFLQHRGLRLAFRLLSFLGISSDLGASVETVDGAWNQLFSVESKIRKNINLEFRKPRPLFSFARNDLCSDNSPMVSSISNSPCAEIIESLQVRLSGLQNILNYEFNDIRLLIQALSHPTSSYAAFFGSYQRLEFLGDAVLDYVVTTYLYNTHEDFDPGKLTNSRSDIVNNNSLACALVEHQIHPYIFHNHPALDSAVAFVTFLLDRTSSYSEQLELLTQEVLKGLRVKLLADVFESIIGAMFVDSNGNLRIVSDLIHRLLDSRIHDYLERNPIHPLKTLHCLYPDLVYTDFQPTDTEEPNNRFKLSATVGGEPVCTYGSSRNDARLALAQRLHVPFRALHPEQS